MSRPKHPSTLDFTAAIELMAAADGGDKRPTFSIAAYSGGVMKVSGWGYPVVVDLSASTAKAPVPALLDHDSTAIVGQCNSVKLTAKRLDVAGVVTGDYATRGDPAYKVVTHAKAGFVWAASVGVDPIKTQFVEQGQTVAVNGRKVVGPVYVVQGRLREVSFLSLGADADAAATVSARMKMAKRNAAAIEPPEVEVENGDGGDELTPAAAEAARGRAILAAGRALKYTDVATIQEIEDKAIEAGWTVERAKEELGHAELAAMRASRPSHVNPHSENPRSRQSLGESNPNILAAALLLHAGRATVAEKALGERAVQVAHDLRCRSLLDLCAHALRAEHLDVPHGKGELIRAAFSTVSLPKALGTSANKIAAVAYAENPATWPAICRTVTLNNFLSHDIIRVILGGAFEKVAADGELKHGSMSEEASSIKADTYGEMLGLTRQAVINDDSGWLNVAEAIGRAGARCVADLIFKCLLTNKAPDGSDFFSAGNGNYGTGADTVLSIDSMGTGRNALSLRTDQNGRNLDLQAQTVLVPTCLELVGREIVASTLVARTSDAGDRAPQGNALQGIADVLAEPRLQNTKLHSSASQTAWYLFSAAGNGAITVGFVDGVQQPILEQVDGPMNVLGIFFRSFIDVGVSLTDPRPCHKMKGAA